MKLDLNCDLGEAEPTAKTRALMRSITSANVACGGHAGNVSTMETCVRLAKQYGVRLGAHPGVPSQFGRGVVDLSTSQLELLLLHQVGALERIAKYHQLKLHHIKLHGSLYHAADANPTLGRAFVKAVARWWPGVKIYARSGGFVANLARQKGVPIWRELFADRAYTADGALLSRDHPNAVIGNLAKVIQRVDQLATQGHLAAESGTTLRLQAETLCLHSDTPSSVKLIRAVAKHLQIR
jgi:UPF0271 protein